MSAISSADPDAASEATPYGSVGLVLSLVAILILTTIFSLIEVAATIGVLAAWHGLHEALETVRAILSPRGGPHLTREQGAVIVGAGLYVANGLAIVAMAAIRDPQRWTSLVAWRGWHLRAHWKLLAALCLLAIVWDIGASLGIEHFHPEAKDWIVAPKETPWLIAFGALVVLLGPFVEENLFRGWIYTSLRSSFGVVFAILVSSVLFALAHWEDTHLYALAVFPVGLALAIVRERTGSIGPSFLFHAFYNSVAFTLLLFDK